ncbi:MICOS complex subunit MIC13 homolog QIL1 [Prorops nasuta]|uniref:MICOS complex subunit MIC13 homolog QIL1 n=1 Tax=Prorops nasuta TaxID=863751 RepID=UPI0034CE3941
MGVLKFTIKYAVIGGVVYYSANELFWSKYDIREKKIEELYTLRLPQITNKLPLSIKDKIPNMPNVSDVSVYCKQNWNRGIFASINFVSELPTHTYNGVSKLYTLVSQYLESTKKPLEKAQ